jgi:hypothetical protein
MNRLSSTPNPTADNFAAWEASASELGLDTGAAPVEPAEPAGSAASPDSSSDADPSISARTGADSADVETDADHDDDEDQDPLDLLTERDEDPHDQAGKPARTDADRLKSLSKRARKLERALKKSTPIVQALRESGMDLRTLLGRSQNLANLEAAMERNPRLRALMNGEDDTPAPRQSSRSRAAEDGDDAQPPYDTTDSVGRHMHTFETDTRSFMREIRAELAAIKQTTGGRLDRVEHNNAQAARANVEREWKAAADAAAERLDKNLRPMFKDAMFSAMSNMLAGRIRATPQQIVDHYLKGMNLSAKTKQVASDAARQRIAQGNQNLPRRPGGGTGQPASPRSAKLPRLGEFNLGLQRKFGAA